jgi:tRNA threonylcarbamoyladenosine biosynthesis protein TsaE
MLQVTRALEEFNVFAREFAASLAPREGSATVVALSGELGAGKTTFVQEVARYFGVEESVTSPTFVIQKNYQLPTTNVQRPTANFQHLVHIDAYRLKSSHELEVLGWKELIADPGNLILIEWPERVEGAIPDDAVRIRFTADGDTRTLTIQGADMSR